GAQAAPAPAPTPQEPATQAPSPGTPAAPAATPPQPPAPPKPTPAEEALAAERIAFDFRVPAERGGGSIVGSAGAIETRGENEAELSGGVEVKYKNLVFRADRIVVHRDTMTVEAEGDVIFDQATRRVTAVRADFDLATETGSFWKATASAEPDQYFWGEMLTKTGDDTYEVRDGVLTSCTGDRTPDWSLRVARARVEVGAYAHLTHTAMRVKKLPVFYWPYMIWPAKTERSSGFLIPNIGYTDTRGVYLGLAYYQVMGPSADLTLQIDGYESTYAGAGAELRYQPSAGTRGALSHYVLADRDASRQESRTVWHHDADDLPWGLKGVVDVNDYSDYDFFREFQRAENENTRRFLYSNAFVSGNWGAQSASVIVDDRETFLGNDRTSTQRQLPEINYKLRKLKLGAMPLYLSIDSTASYFQSTTSDLFDNSYGRFDFAPELTLPLRVAPWLNVAVNAAGRATWWGDSVPSSEKDPTTGATVRRCDEREAAADEFYCGEALTRTYPAASLDLVGPSISKIFESPGGRFAKFKHLIEPRFSYNYTGEFDDQGRVPRFDEIDAFGSREVGEVTLVNRVLAKPTDPEQGGAFEIFSFELGQAFSFVDEQPLQKSADGLTTSKESAIFGRVRYNPAKGFDLQAKASWSTLFSSLDSTSLSAHGRGERVRLDLTWYTNYNAELAETQSDQARVGVDFALVPKRLSLGGQVNYNLLTSEVLQQIYRLSYHSQCWSVVVEAREQTTASYQTRDYRFLLDLKNVGTFLDLHGGDSTARF
ncbi:MAG TPA: LPS assembly protein LptD, partial [Thermoanaerobaculia bacterium]|nr:LPS assembly protein LptD [Thermoanaerobaculia bacterium]